MKHSPCIILMLFCLAVMSMVLAPPCPMPLGLVPPRIMSGEGECCPEPRLSLESFPTLEQESWWTTLCWWWTESRIAIRRKFCTAMNYRTNYQGNWKSVPFSSTKFGMRQNLPWWFRPPEAGPSRLPRFAPAEVELGTVDLRLPRWLKVPPWEPPGTPPPPWRELRLLFPPPPIRLVLAFFILRTSWPPRPILHENAYV